MSRTREPRAPAPVVRIDTRVRVSGGLMRCGVSNANDSGLRVLPGPPGCGLHGRNSSVVSALESY